MGKPCRCVWHSTGKGMPACPQCGELAVPADGYCPTCGVGAHEICMTPEGKLSLDHRGRHPQPPRETDDARP